jgi:Holliday junction resolvase-like predicted endonuclease
VEVKLRAGSGLGGAVGAVDREKRRRLRQAARIRPSRNPQAPHVRIGFEAVAVEAGRLTRTASALDDSWGSESR